MIVFISPGRRGQEHERDYLQGRTEQDNLHASHLALGTTGCRANSAICASWVYDAPRNFSPRVTEITPPLADPLPERQEPALKRQIRHSAHGTPAEQDCAPERRSSCSVARNLIQDLGSVRHRPREQGPTRTCVRQLRRFRVAVLCCCTLGPGCSNLASDQVELRGLEPLTPCLQTTGSTSTRVHPRRSPSRSVYPRPSRSIPVAVLPCCTPRRSGCPPEGHRSADRTAPLGQLASARSTRAR